MGIEKIGEHTIIQFYGNEGIKAPRLGMRQDFLTGETGAFDMMLENFDITAYERIDVQKLESSKGSAKASAKGTTEEAAEESSEEEEESAEEIVAFDIEAAQQTTYHLKQDLNEGEYDDYDIAKVVVEHIEVIRSAKAEEALPMGRDVHTFVLSGSEDLVDITIDCITGAYDMEKYVSLSTNELGAAAKQGLNPLSRVSDRDAANYACAAACLELAKGPHFDQEKCWNHLVNYFVHDRMSRRLPFPNYANLSKALDKVVPGDTNENRAIRTGLMLSVAFGCAPIVLGDALGRYAIQLEKKLRKKS